jgi:hypothetical protein
MTWLTMTIQADEEDGPIPAEALQLAAILTRQGFQLEAREGCIMVTGSDGVMRGILDQGHHVRALLEHAGALYRLARMTAATTT